jgi:hypothetical protein
MSQEEQAIILAEWLADSPGSPPEGVDADVVECVFALRPDLAPPPRVTADDILEGVQAGPFGSGDVAADATTTEVAAVVPLRPAVRRARWAAVAFGGGTAATIALAATVLLTARVAFFSPGGEIPVLQEAKSPMAATTEADTGVKSPPMLVGKPKPKPKGMPKPLVANAEAADDYRKTPSSQAAHATRERLEMPIAELEPQPSPPPVPGAPPAENNEYEAVADADIDEFDEDPYAAEGEWVRQEEYIPEALARRDVSSAVAGAEIQDDAAWDQEDAEEQLGALGYVDQPIEAEEKSSPSFGRSKKDRSQTRQPKASAPAMADNSPAMDEAAPAPMPDGLDSIDWRTAAMPTDLSSSWRSQVDGATLAEVDNSRDEANNMANRGSYSEAGEVMLQVVNPPAEVGQAQAAAATEYFIAAGDPPSAATAAQKGLSLSSANTPWRSYLLVLLGDARRAMGDESGAISAWQEAAALNQSR